MLLGCIEDLIPLGEQTPLKRMARLEQNNKNVMTDSHFPETFIGYSRGAENREPQEAILAEETALPSLSEWYKLLVKESNQVFLAEYLLRNFDTHPPIPNAALNQ